MGSVGEKYEKIYEWIAEERINLIDLGSLQIKPCRLIRYFQVRTGYGGSGRGRAVIVRGLLRQGANVKMQCSTSGTVPGRAAVGLKALRKEAQLKNPHMVKKKPNCPGKLMEKAYPGKSALEKDVPSKRSKGECK